MTARHDHLFLHDLDAPADLRVLGALGAAAPRAVPASAARARLMADALPGGRLAHFASRVAQLLDLSVEAAEDLLDQVDAPGSWTSDVPPPARAFWVPGGPSVAHCVRGFVRIPAGEAFPEHEHLGEERGLVLAGAFVDTALGRTLGPGDSFTMPEGSHHQPVVLEDGVDLLMLVVVRGGYKVGDQVLAPRD